MFWTFGLIQRFLLHDALGEEFRIIIDFSHRPDKKSIDILGNFTPSASEMRSFIWESRET